MESWKMRTARDTFTSKNCKNISFRWWLTGERESMYKVIVDIAPKTIPGTNRCHKYVFGEYKTKKEAQSISSVINMSTGHIGIATILKK